MREKKVYRKILMYNYTELEALKEYLEEKALEGWILKGINTWLTFEKGEPQKITYSVEIDEKASIYDTFAEVYPYENIEESMKAGWVFVSGKGKIKVYKTKNENAIPICRDEKQKYKAITKSTFMQSALAWFFLPILMFFNLYMMNINYNNFSLGIMVYLVNIIYAIYFILLTSQIIRFLVWKNKAKKRIEIGEKVSFCTLKHLKNKNKIIGITFLIVLALFIILAIISIFTGDMFTAIFLVTMIVIMMIIILITVWIQRQRFSPSTVVALSFGVGLGFGLLIIVVSIFIVVFIL